MMRLSFFGSTGSLCPTYSSRLPLPLVSMMRGVQPCDFASSPVSRYILVLSQPTTPLAGPPALVHSVWLASFAKYRWCVEKQVLMSFHSPVLGSYIDRCRGESLSGAIFADGWLEPTLQKSGCAPAGRMRAVNHTRPCASIIGLWMLVWPSQIGSSPQ